VSGVPRPTGAPIDSNAVNDDNDGMAVMTIRNLDEGVRDKLRVRAALHGRSMEAEARAILTAAVDSPIERSLLDVLGEMRDILDGEELPLPPREGGPREPFA
jgi:plasmid stability protein